MVEKSWCLLEYCEFTLTCPPEKKYGKETVIACYESKKMLKAKIRIKIRKIGTYMSIL